MNDTPPEGQMSVGGWGGGRAHFALDDGTSTKMIVPQYAFGGGGVAEGMGGCTAVTL